jgi:hypothetical protein
MSNWISFGYDNHAVAGAVVSSDHTAARKALLKDLVKAHKAAVDIGITDVAVLRGLYGIGLAAAALAAHIGVDKVLKYLAALVNLSEKHKGYMLAIEKDKTEGKRVLKSLRKIFNERLFPGKQVKITKAAAKSTTVGAWAPLILLAGLGAAIFFVVRALSKDKGGGEKGLLDYFVLKVKGQARPEDDAGAASLAASLNLPKTAAAIRTNTALPSDENWPGTNKSVVEYVKAYTSAQVPILAAPVAITPVIPTSDAARVLAYASALAAKKLGKSGFGDPDVQRTEAIGAAMRMRMTITAQVIRDKSMAWPTNENWSGTTTTVNTYVKAHLGRIGLGAAMASAAVVGQRFAMFHRPPPRPTPQAAPSGGGRWGALMQRAQAMANQAPPQQEIEAPPPEATSEGCRIKGLGGAFELGAGAGKDDEGVESCGNNDSDAMGFGPLVPVAVGLGSYLLGYRLGAGHWGIAGDQLVAGSLEEIVGQAKAAKARKARKIAAVRQGLRPPTRRPGRLPQRAPGAPRRKEIVTMPEMVITPGTAGRPMDPQLAEILRIIEHGSAPLRGHGMAIQRSRGGWPGSRGEGAY